MSARGARLKRQLASYHPASIEDPALLEREQAYYRYGRKASSVGLEDILGLAVSKHQCTASLLAADASKVEDRSRAVASPEPNMYSSYSPRPLSQSTHSHPAAVPHPKHRSRRASLTVLPIATPSLPSAPPSGVIPDRQQLGSARYTVS